MTGRFDFEREVLRSDLPTYSRLLALTLATWADKQTGEIPQRFSPSLSTLGRAAGMSHGSVLNHLRQLESGGWIVRFPPEPELARSKRARTEYRLTLPTRSGADHVISTGRSGADLDTAGTRSGDGLEVGQELTGTRSGDDHNPNKNTNPSSKRGPDAEDCAQQFADWMTETYRTTVDRAHASRVIAHITNGRQVTHNVLSYVKAAVVKNPDNYLPTYTPPRYQAPDRPPVDAGSRGLRV